MAAYRMSHSLSASKLRNPRHVSWRSDTEKLSAAEKSAAVDSSTLSIVLVERKGLPEDAIISIRVGSIRQQTQIASGKAIRFPVTSLAEGMQAQVDVLQPVGSTYLVLKPNEAQYMIRFEDNEASVAQASCELEVRRAKPKDSIHPSEYETAKPNSTLSPTASRAKAAKDYLEAHELLEFMQVLLQTVIRARPSKPYEYMARHLAGGYEVSDAKTPSSPATLSPRRPGVARDALPKGSLEFALLASSGLPEACKLSIRAGTIRRQAPAPPAAEPVTAVPRATAKTAGRSDVPVRLRFGGVCPARGLPGPIKIDAMKPFASAQLQLQQQTRRRYQVVFSRHEVDASSNSGTEIRCDLEVMMANNEKPAPAATGNQEASQRAEDDEFLLRGGEGPLPSNRTAEGAKDFLESYQIIQFTSDLLQSMAKIRHTRPYDYMAMRFLSMSKARDIPPSLTYTGAVAVAQEAPDLMCIRKRAQQSLLSGVDDGSLKSSLAKAASDSEDRRNQAQQSLLTGITTGSLVRQLGKAAMEREGIRQKAQQSLVAGVAHGSLVPLLGKAQKLLAQAVLEEALFDDVEAQKLLAQGVLEETLFDAEAASASTSGIKVSGPPGAVQVAVVEDIRSKAQDCLLNGAIDGSLIALLTKAKQRIDALRHRARLQFSAGSLDGTLSVSLDRARERKQASVTPLVGPVPGQPMGPSMAIPAAKSKAAVKAAAISNLRRKAREDIRAANTDGTLAASVSASVSKASALPAQLPTKPPHGKGGSANTAQISTPATVPPTALTRTPAKAPAKVPAKAPAKLPAKAPANVPAKASAKAPAMLPAKVPAAVPVKAQTKTPTHTPVAPAGTSVNLQARNAVTGATGQEPAKAGAKAAVTTPSPSIAAPAARPSIADLRRKAREDIKKGQANGSLEVAVSNSTAAPAARPSISDLRRKAREDIKKGQSDGSLEVAVSNSTAAPAARPSIADLRRKARDDIKKGQADGSLEAAVSNSTAAPAARPSIADLRRKAREDIKKGQADGSLEAAVSNSTAAPAARPSISDLRRKAREDIKKGQADGSLEVAVSNSTAEAASARKPVAKVPTAKSSVAMPSSAKASSSAIPGSQTFPAPRAKSGTQGNVAALKAKARSQLSQGSANGKLPSAVSAAKQSAKAKSLGRASLAIDAASSSLIERAAAAHLDVAAAPPPAAPATGGKGTSEGAAKASAVPPGPSNATGIVAPAKSAVPSATAKAPTAKSASTQGLRNKAKDSLFRGNADGSLAATLNRPKASTNADARSAAPKAVGAPAGRASARHAAPAGRASTGRASTRSAGRASAGRVAAPNAAAGTQATKVADLRKKAKNDLLKGGTDGSLQVLLAGAKGKAPALKV